MSLPPIVSADEWQIARDALLVKEKAATRALDALAAERRRLPMVEFGNDYVFEGLDGPKSLLDLFAGRHQLVVYQFMDLGPDHYCPGCSGYTDNVGHLAQLHVRDTTYVTVSNRPLAQITAYWKRMGWTVPVYSSRGTTFSADCGARDLFGLTAFVRDGDRVFRTYFTAGRGVDRLRFDNNILDLTAFGRQENWEDSPAGWLQKPTNTWHVGRYNEESK